MQIISYIVNLHILWTIEDEILLGYIHLRIEDLVCLN